MSRRGLVTVRLSGEVYGYESGLAWGVRWPGCRDDAATPARCVRVGRVCRLSGLTGCLSSGCVVRRACCALGLTVGCMGHVSPLFDPGLSRRTKVVATLGPSSPGLGDVAELLSAGVDVVRLSLAHDPVDVVLDRLELVRSAADAAGDLVAVMADLPGPKMRVADLGLPGGRFTVGERWDVLLGAVSDPAARVLGVEMAEQSFLALQSGVFVTLGDGAVVLEVLSSVSSDPRRVVAQVRSGGRLAGRPGFHVPSSVVAEESPTEFDVEAARVLAAAGVDALAVSFVRSAADVERVRLAAPGVAVVAKIETVEAVSELDAIVAASDAVMVARGDLGLEYPLAEVPFLQKQIIATSVAAARPVITATQVLESMVSASAPTRAEATDVVNSVLDGTSAIMLSAETAVGSDPANVVATLARIAARADVAVPRRVPPSAPVLSDSVRAATTHALSQAAIESADRLGAVAIVCLTETGLTARAVARFRPSSNVLAVTSSPLTARLLGFAWGVEPVVVDHDVLVPDRAVGVLVDRGLLSSGDRVVVVSGPHGSRATDTVSTRFVP